MSDGDTFVDSNVVVYMHHVAETAKRARAKQVLGPGSDVFVVSTQVLTEVYSTLTRKLRPPIDPLAAEGTVRDLCKFRVVPIDASMVLDSITLGRERQLSVWDALIVQAALAAGCTRLLSEDFQDGTRFGPDGSLRVENPFAGL